MGLITIGLAGGDGGKMARSAICDHCLVVPTRQSSTASRSATSRSTTSSGTWCTRCWRRIAARPSHGSRGMKYVDEFRDPPKAQSADRRNRAAAPRESQLAAHTAAANHGSVRRAHPFDLPLRHRGHAAERVEFVHGPGCPVCVLPMGRVDDCVAIAERPEVIFTTFGDAMRVPGSRKSLLQAKADGADVRMVYSPLDALALARAQSGPRGGILRHRLRDDHAVHRADASAGRT